MLSGAENFFRPFLSKCTTTSNHEFSLEIEPFSIRILIEKNGFARFQEFSAPLSSLMTKA